MKKLISFLLCLMVGLVGVALTYAINNPARGKPLFEKPTVIIQPLQEQAEFESDVGNLNRITILSDKNPAEQFGEIKVKKRPVMPRLKPETVYRN